LEIDKILIRYFSSHTVTAQKQLFLHFGTHFALPTFSHFLGSYNSQKRSFAPPPKTRPVLHEPTTSRPKTAANRIEETSYKCLINIYIYMKFLSCQDIPAKKLLK
jgi:hypothetical protein